MQILMINNPIITLSELISILGFVAGVSSLIITYFRFRKERPVLNYEIQSCEYDPGGLNLNFIVNNSGERGTSITNIILDYPHGRLSPDDPDKEEPVIMGWWKSVSDFVRSYIIYIEPTSSKSISAEFSLYQPNLNGMKIQFDIVTTTGRQRKYAQANYRDNILSILNLK